MTTLTLLILVASVALALSQRLKLPVAPLAVTSGFVAQYAGIPLDPTIIGDALLLSATVLVFTVGIEIDRRHVRNFQGPAVLIGVLQCAIVAGIAIPLALLLELDTWTIIYLSLALAGGSTFVMMDILRQRQRFFEPTGRLGLGASLTQDFLVIALLAVLVAWSDPSVYTRWAIVAFLGLWLGSFVMRLWVAPYFMIRLKLDQEERLLVILSVLFAFSGVAFMTGLPALTGAFFAGVAFSHFPVSGIVRGQVNSFANFFVILFLTTLGTVLVLPGPVELASEAIFVAALLVLRPALLLPIVRRAGFTFRSGLETVVLLSPVGELGLIVALVGVEHGHIGPSQLSTIAIVSVVTLTLVPWLSSPAMTRRVARLYPSRSPGTDGRPKNHVLLVGAGEGGAPFLESMQDRRDDIVVIDVDPGVVDRLNQSGVRAVRGDVADAGVQAHAGFAEARAIVSTIPSLEDNLRLLGLPRAEGVPVIVRVFAEQDAEAIRKAGGEAVVDAEVAHAAFLTWYENLGPRKTGTAACQAAR